MIPCGLHIGFPNTPAIVQISLKSVKFCFSLDEAGRFRALSNATLTEQCSAFYASKSVRILSETKVQAFKVYYTFLFAEFRKFLERNRCFTLKMHSNVLTV